MRKILTLILCIVLLAMLTACGCENTPDTSTEPSEEVATGIQPNRVQEGSVHDLGVRAAVKNYLDTFITSDIEAIDAILHEEDKWLFNFEDEGQVEFYKTIFPRISYEFKHVDEHEGVYGVMTEITSPDMGDVYGTIITDYIDSATGNSNASPQDVMENNADKMLEMIASEDANMREELLYIYVQYIDGEYIVRCDPYLANELTGGAPEMSDAISSTLSETLEALGE